MSTTLRKSYLCADCETIGPDARNCVCCQSRSLLNLASILNRKSLSPEARAVLRCIPRFWEESRLA